MHIDKIMSSRTDGAEQAGWGICLEFLLANGRACAAIQHPVFPRSCYWQEKLPRSERGLADLPYSRTAVVYRFEAPPAKRSQR